MKDQHKTTVAATAVLALALAVSAQSVPNLINYQGRLTDQTGAPLALGVYGIQFKLWDSPSATNAADLIWAEQQRVNLQSNGVFNVILGSSGGAPVPGATPAVSDLAYAFSAPGRFLGLTVVSNNAGPATSPTEIFPRQQLLSVPFAMVASSLVADLANALCPPGTVTAWMGIDTNPPAGWEFCWEQVVGRNDPKYARLFSVIDTSNGAGDGTSTFNIPDLRGMFLRGVNGSRTGAFADPDVTGRTVRTGDAFLTNAVGSVQLDNFKTHTHTYGMPTYQGSSGSGPYGDGLFWHGGYRDSGPTGSAGGNETRPKNVYVQYLIKL
jgi:hypothetical protein